MKTKDTDIYSDQQAGSGAKYPELSAAGHINGAAGDQDSEAPVKPSGSHMDGYDLSNLFPTMEPPYGLDIKIMNAVQSADSKRRERVAEKNFLLAAVLAVLGLVAVAVYFLHGQLTASFSSLAEAFVRLGKIELHGGLGPYLAVGTATLILLFADRMLRKYSSRKKERDKAGRAV